jgi:hypothetical protein
MQTALQAVLHGVAGDADTAMDEAKEGVTSGGSGGGSGGGSTALTAAAANEQAASGVLGIGEAAVALANTSRWVGGRVSKMCGDSGMHRCNNV